MLATDGLLVSELNVYPIKSAAGIAVKSHELDDFGLHGDRRWMLVDETNTFISQRTAPRLALVRVSFRGAGLWVEAPGMSPFDIPAANDAAPRAAVRIWNDECRAVYLDAAADEWFSDAIEKRCRLVHLPADSVRTVDLTYAPDGTRVGFADGFPLLLIGQGSLDHLNSRLDTPVPMNRFRPNLVVAGTTPHAEDGWRRVRVGAFEMRVAKPCGRCVITTVDQATGAMGTEPLRTLATYRKRGGKVQFGQNVLPPTRGTLRVGDPVTILE